jgi:hypothetical protein
MKVVWRIANWVAQLLESPWRYRMQELMVDLVDKPMAGYLAVHDIV